MNIPSYTNEELIDRMWAKEIIIQTMNHQNYYRTNEMREKELETLWVSTPENMAKASLGFNNGYYVGMDEIRRHYISDHLGNRRDALKKYTEIDSSVAFDDSNLGIGCAEYHSTASPLVVVADDGLSARYLGYHFGYICTANPDNTGAAYMTIGLTFADFLLENGEWKIFNLVNESDHTIETGENYAQYAPRRADTPDPLDYMYKDPTIKRIVYNPLFGWEYLYQDMPKPYKTFDPEKSYGPDGNLGKPYYERERLVF